LKLAGVLGGGGHACAPGSSSRVATHPGKPGKSGKVRGKNIGPGKSGNFSLGPGFCIFSGIFPMSGTSCRGRENLPDNQWKH